MHPPKVHIPLIMECSADDYEINRENRVSFEDFEIDEIYLAYVSLISSGKHPRATFMHLPALITHRNDRDSSLVVAPYGVKNYLRPDEGPEVTIGIKNTFGITSLRFEGGGVLEGYFTDMPDADSLPAAITRL